MSLRTSLKQFPDPVVQAINTSRRLLAAVEAAESLPLYPGSIEPRTEMVEARRALFRHRDQHLLNCVPRTAAGCVALARYAVEFAEKQGVPLDPEEGSAVLLGLMAQCPAVASEA